MTHSGVSSAASREQSLPSPRLAPPPSAALVFRRRVNYRLHRVHSVPPSVSACERSSAAFNPRAGPTWKAASRRLAPPLCPPTTSTSAGRLDGKKSTNCLIIQIFVIMNCCSTVQEHGVQPVLPPQHSSCES